MIRLINHKLTIACSNSGVNTSDAWILAAMKRAQIVVLGIAVTAGIGAMFLMRGGNEPPPPREVVTVSEPSAPAMEVLVAAADLPMGRRLNRADLRWQPWPADSVPVGLMTRSAASESLDQIAGSLARSQILAGEPIRRERLIQSENGGFMSAILPAGKRAVAISIDTRGSSTAGGFILPNDRVDVLRTFRTDDAGGQGDQQATEILLRNIRVLAIGRNVQTDDQGNSSAEGETATLELTPSQAEIVTLAQRTGHVSLALRSLADAELGEDELDEGGRGLTVVRFGIPRQTTTP